MIIYGATAPDAKLRIDGEPVSLDPDGRFHFHFHFKDGKYHLPVTATSADAAETRSALLSFLRLTALGDGTQATPQRDYPNPPGSSEE